VSRIMIYTSVPNYPTSLRLLLRHANGDFVQWFEALEETAFSRTWVSEVRRQFRRLSSCNVERRAVWVELSPGWRRETGRLRAVLRALHFLLIREVIREIQWSSEKGCNSGHRMRYGVAGAHGPGDGSPPRIIASIEFVGTSECKWTYRSWAFRRSEIQRDHRFR